MGQYFLILNLDKRELLHPHKLGMGLKLWEICANHGVGIIAYLLRKSDELGGGDIDDPKKAKWAGHWAGDRLVVVGDYDSSGLYQEARGEKAVMNEEKPFTDISLKAREEYEKFLGEPLGKRWDKP